MKLPPITTEDESGATVIAETEPPETVAVKGSVAPFAGDRAASDTLATPFVLVKLPPMYTALLVADTVLIVELTLGLKDGSSVPVATSKAATRYRAWPSTEVNWPAAYRVFWSGETARSLTWPLNAGAKLPIMTPVVRS